MIFRFVIEALVLLGVIALLKHFEASSAWSLFAGYVLAQIEIVVKKDDV